MRFIHTADLHLGKPFSGMGEKGGALRAARFDTLGRIVELAQSERADCLVIAGDLFDSNEVRRETVRKTAELLSRIDPTPVLILPGTHDVLDEGSVFRTEWLAACPNVKVFGVDGPTFKVGETAFHGRANDTRQGGVHPLTTLAPDPSARHNVAVAHASVEIEGKSSPEDYLVEPGELASSGMEYVALGHWHRKGEFSSEEVVAWFCGAPEATKYDESDGAGYVLLVELGDGRPSVKPLRVGTFEWKEKTLDVSTCPPGGPLESEIRSLQGDRVILRLRIKGTLQGGEELDAGALEEEFEGAFYHLEIDDSRVRYPLEDVEGLFASGTVGDLYVSRMKALAAEAETDDERAVLEKALSLGAGYISGRLEV